MTVRIAPGADIDPSAKIGDGSSVWHLAQVRDNAVLGTNCIIGRGAYIGSGATLGDNCKVQNYALVYEPAKLGNGVFIGPAVVLTNDHFPMTISQYSYYIPPCSHKHTEINVVFCIFSLLFSY